MAAINDADGNVAQVTTDGRLPVEVGGNVSVNATEYVARVDRTLTTPTSETVWMPNRLYEGLAVTKGLVSRATAATGGTQLSPQSRLLANSPFVQDFVSTLGPGQSISVQASTSILEEFNLFASATWIEEAI